MGLKINGPKTHAMHTAYTMEVNGLLVLHADANTLNW